MKVAATLLVLSLALTAPAGAQDAWRELVQSQLDAAAASLAEAGFRGGALHHGTLVDEGSERIKMPISGSSSTEFKLVGVCDADCSDIDLVLLDGQGRTVESDLLADDVPIVGATGAGSYTAEVRMVACTANPCRYAVQAFVR